MRTALESELRLNGTRLWLDSKTALCWIKNNGKWKQFVIHRVKDILKSLSILKNQCPTKAPLSGGGCGG